MNYVEVAQQHVESLYPYIVYHRPALQTLPPGAIMGTWSISVPGKMRYILARDLEVARGVLPGDLARAWIRDQYDLPIKRKKVQIAGKGYPVPLYARKGKWGQCSYVDIKGAYLTILSLGYDLEYRPLQYLLARPITVPDEIAANKFAYSLAVTMSGPILSNLVVMGKEGLFKHTPMNLYSNPCLYYLAQDTLNGIGSEMIAVLGDRVVYANTDGFIVKEGYEGFAIKIIESWGFKAAIKHQGDTEVFGVAAWKIGDNSTRRLDINARDFTGQLMTKEQRHWLKSRWARQRGKT